MYSTIQSYYDSSTTSASGDYSLVAEFAYKDITTLSDTSIRSQIVAAINSGYAAADESAIYQVFFVGSIPWTGSFAGFATSWCGYHYYFDTTLSGVTYRLKYAVIGDSAYSPSGADAASGCQAFTSNSVNHNAAADGKLFRHKWL